MAYQGIVFMAGAGLILLCRVIIGFMVDRAYYESWRYIPVLIMATVFSCFSSFMSSIYMVQKNGRSNLYTMMAGAAANIVLNLLLIPKWEAQGAAVATFVSYVLVFVLRAAGTKKYININVSPLFMALNCTLMGALSYVMVNELKGWRIIATVITLVIVAVNGMPLLAFVKSVLKSLKRRKNKSMP